MVFWHIFCHRILSPFHTSDLLHTRHSGKKEKQHGSTVEISKREYDELLLTIKSLRAEVQSLKATIAKENVTSRIDENPVSVDLSVTTPAPVIATNTIQPFYLAIPIGANLFSAEDKSTNPLPDSKTHQTDSAL